MCYDARLSPVHDVNLFSTEAMTNNRHVTCVNKIIERLQKPEDIYRRI